jgi:hypothetical protein
MSLPEKLKSSLYICCLEKNKKTRIELQFSKEHFIINFLETLNNEYLKEVKELFSPFVSKNNRQIKINYIYIKNIYADNDKLLKFTIYNPLSKSILTLIFNHFKYKKSIIFAELNIPHSMLPSIASNLNKKVAALTKNKINDFINIILLLYQFTGIERKYNNIIEDLFLKAFNFGKHYYDKSVKEFSFSDKINKKSMSEETAKRINDFISEMKIEKENNTKTNIIEQIKKANKSSSDIEEEEEEKSKTKNMEIIDKILVNNGMDGSEYNPSIFFALKIESINKRDLFQNYEKFKKYQSEIKEKASYFTEITINLIFKVFNIDKNDLDNKYNFINKTAIGYRISLKQPIPEYDVPETNFGLVYNTKILDQNKSAYKEKDYFGNINKIMKKYYSDESTNDKDNEKHINELLEFSKKFNSFVPNNSMENILDNTSQVIHRKFFELLFKTYFSDIMEIESEKYKTLSSDAFHQVLLVLRRLKKILFTNKNLNYYDEFLFFNEQ